MSPPSDTPGTPGTPASASHHHAHTHPSAQQRLYVPSGTPSALDAVEDGLIEREGFEAAAHAGHHGHGHRARSPHSPASRSRSRPVGASGSASASGSGLDAAEGNDADADAAGAASDTQDRSTSADDWAHARDGAISRRKPWRRASPRWLMPFVLGASLSLAITAAPRAELYLDFACLAHPPRIDREPGNDTGGDGGAGVGIVQPVYGAQAVFNTTADSASAITRRDTDTGMVTDMGTDMSPADKWFLGAQRDIWRYLHRNDVDRPLPQPQPEPGPLPLPEVPGGGAADEPPKKTPSPFPEIDPAVCKKDKKVARAATQLMMVLTMSAGILSALTTGFWASVSDRVGRRKVLSMVQFGLLLNDACFLLIASYPHVLMQGSIYLLLLGPMLDGLLGGFSTVTATMHAYISDVTPDGSRATVFARLSAALMGGFALGPVLGAWMVGVTGNILFPFYVTVTVHMIATLLLRFLLPESLSTEARAVLQKRATAASEAAREREAAERDWEESGYARIALVDTAEPQADPGASSLSRLSEMAVRTRVSRRMLGNLRRLGRRAFVVVRPLAVFVPTERDGRKDYNLMLMGMTYFLMTFMIGLLQIKSVYVQNEFGWTTAEIGPFMSFLSGGRLVILLAVMPIVTYKLKPYFTPRTVVEPQSTDPSSSAFSDRTAREPERLDATADTEQSPLLAAPARSRSASTSSSCSRSRSPSPSPATKAKTQRPVLMDLWILRWCITVEIVSYLVVGSNASGSQTLFVAASGMTIFAAPGLAAANSLALSFLPNTSEAGRLFGGLAVAQASASALIAPFFFATVYSATIGFYPPTMFLVAGAILILAQTTLAFVRVRPPRDDEERGRGRATRTKPVRTAE